MQDDVLVPRSSPRGEQFLDARNRLFGDFIHGLATADIEVLFSDREQEVIASIEHDPREFPDRRRPDFDLLG